MRRPFLRRLALAGLVTAASGALPARAAPPSEPPASVRELSDPRFPVRRAAEARLEAEGRSAILDALADEEARARLDAWTEALDACRASEDPALAEAAERILRRIEAAATDDQVRTSVRLLKIRLERLVLQLLRPEAPPDAESGDDEPRFPGADERPPAADVAYASVRGLFPDARAALLAILESSTDPRRLAGALAALCAESGDGPEDDRVLASIARAHTANPARFEGVRGLEAVAGGSPVAVLALALALSGHVDAVVSLGFSDFAEAETFTTWLRAHLKRRGLGDLGLGAFLDRVLEAKADDEAEAARRALVGGLPWLARLTARRALFLTPGHPTAGPSLVAADRALGLLATAALDAGTEPGDAKDAPEAVAVDEGLRSGRLSQRLAWQGEAGETTAEGLAPVAITDTTPAAPGRLFYGAVRGRVFVVEAATGTPIVTLSPASTRAQSARIPRAIAATGPFVATVTSPDGRLVLHAEKETTYEPVRVERGPFLTVTATKDGAFWALAADGGLHRGVGRGELERRSRVPRFRELGDLSDVRLYPLDGGALLLVTRDAAFRVDPATGAATLVLRDAEEGLRAGPHGDDVLVGQGDRWRRFGPDGALRGEGQTPDGGAIMGLAGDPASKTVYLCLMDALVAVDAERGTIRWVEHVGGSGPPRVGAGMVAVSAGTGVGEHGDNRTERTIFALTAGAGAGDPFGPEERTTTVELAVTAAREGRPGVALALLDPVREWLLPAERERVELAIHLATPRVPRATPR